MWLCKTVACHQKVLSITRLDFLLPKERYIRNYIWLISLEQFFLTFSKVFRGLLFPLSSSS